MNDNNKMLERVLLMMKYDSSKTLTENSDVVKNEFSQILNEKVRFRAPRGNKVTKTKATKSAAPAPIKLPPGLTTAQAKLAGQYKSIYGKSPTKAQLKTFQANGGKAGTVNINAPSTSKVTVQPAKGPAKKGPRNTTPKDKSILSRFTGSVKKYPWRYAIGLGLTGAGLYYFLRDNTEVAPCLLDSLSEEEMASLNGAGTSGTITRTQVGNRLADLNGGLIFSLDKPDVVTANGKYKGSYSCEGGALKISSAGSEITLGSTASADTGTNGGGGTSGGGGGGSYRQCPETFPIAMNCKNSTIARVQGCIGVTQDGAFGPKTSAALVAKGADGSSITQATIDKVCGGGAAEKEKDPSSALSDDFSGQKSTGDSASTGASEPQGDTNL